MDACRGALIENGIWLCQHPVPVEHPNPLGLVTKTHTESGQGKALLPCFLYRQAGTWDWIDTENYRFRMSVAAGRTTLDKDALREELTEIFHAEHLGDTDVDTLLARCEHTGLPFEKLSISPIN